MNFQQTMDYLRHGAGNIGRMAKQGDALAKTVFNAYKAAYSSQLDIRLQNELIKVVNEYLVRSMTLTEIDDLERLYGADHPLKQAFRVGPGH